MMSQYKKGGGPKIKKAANTKKRRANTNKNCEIENATDMCYDA